MAMHHAQTWEEGNYLRTAVVLSFYSAAARDAYRAQCAQRFEPINSKQQKEMVADGRPMYRVSGTKETGYGQPVLQH